MTQTVIWVLVVSLLTILLFQAIDEPVLVEKEGKYLHKPFQTMAQYQSSIVFPISLNTSYYFSCSIWITTFHPTPRLTDHVWCFTSRLQDVGWSVGRGSLTHRSLQCSVYHVFNCGCYLSSAILSQYSILKRYCQHLMQLNKFCNGVMPVM